MSSPSAKQSQLFSSSSIVFAALLLLFSDSLLTSTSTYFITAFTLPSKSSSSSSSSSCKIRCWIHKSLSSCNSDLDSAFVVDNDQDRAVVVVGLLEKDDTEYINYLVQERSQARWQGNYTGADILRHQITNFTGIPSGYEIFLQDFPRSVGGSSRWSLVRTTTGNDDGRQNYDEQYLSGPTVLQLAHAAMGFVIEENQQKIEVNNTKQQQLNINESLEALVQQAKNRLEKIEHEMIIQSTDNDDDDDNDDDPYIGFGRSTKKTMVQYELGGRKAADAAFWFALSGIKDKDLFHRLAEIAKCELNRFGQRPSCRSKDVHQILERFAAAGLKSHDDLEAVAQKCLLQKQQQQQDDGLSKIDNDINEVNHRDSGADTDSDSDSNNEIKHHQYQPENNYLNLHSDRSLLLLWKFSTKQKKQRAFLHSAQKHWEQYQETTIATTQKIESISSNKNEDEIQTPSSVSSLNVGSNETNVAMSIYDWNGIFEDASRPLVIDVGCGMGVSLLGLASASDQSGIDSSRLMLGENNNGNNQTEFLKWSDCNFVGVDLGALGIGYGRGIAHRWNLNGHLHYSVDAAEDFFQHLHSYPGEIRCCMVQFPTPFRLQTNKDGGNSQLPTSKYDGFMVTEKLLELIHSNLHPKKGKLLLQSNCEDVAVWMRNLACQEVGFAAINDINIDKSDIDVVSSYTDKESDFVSSQQRIPQRTVDYVAMGGERAEGGGWFQREILHSEGATETEVACAINGTPVHRCLLKVQKK